MRNKHAKWISYELNIHKRGGIPLPIGPTPLLKFGESGICGGVLTVGRFAYKSAPDKLDN